MEYRTYGNDKNLISIKNGVIQSAPQPGDVVGDVAIVVNGVRTDAPDFIGFINFGK